MKKTQPFLIAIFDANTLMKELLHNKLEHLGYKIAFSCSSLKDFFLYLNERPCLLIVGIDQNHQDVWDIIKKTNNTYPKLKMLLYGDDKKLDISFLKSIDHVISSCVFRDLISQLEKILPEHPLHQLNQIKDNGDVTKDSNLASDLFTAIIKDEKKYEILKLAAKGKSSKQMVPLIGIDYNHIETYRKQIIHETDCNNMYEVIAKAKDLHVI